MADENAEAELDWSGRQSLLLDEDTFFAMEGLQATFQQLEAELRQQDVSEELSTEYCNNFCQALMHYAGSRNSVEHGLPLLEVYCLSINCFAAARPHLTGDSPNVALVLKRLALSCLELLLSVPQNEIPLEAWLQFHGSVQAGHEAMLQYGSTDLHALLNITGEGGAWNNPVLVALLTGQSTDPDEVNAYLALEGEGFMEMRIKHLEKVGEVEKALILNKACANCSLLPNQSTFRQTFVTQLCQLLPSEEAILEISRIDAKDVLDIICNMDAEGEESTAFILCTTYFTQQLQQDNLDCSWELTLLWSKLQRRIDVSLESFIERCLQFAAIARTIYHLLFLIRVIQTEAMHLGLAVSTELCVKALRLPNQDVDAKTMICKAVACLLPEDLEVIRACQLTEFLLCPAQEAFDVLEELYTRPDQKYDEENAIIPNSLRCELLLSLKGHWPFDPEFWDWKTLKRYCAQLLGLEPEEEVEDEAVPEELCNVGAVLNEEAGKEEEGQCQINEFSSTEQEQTVEKTESEKGQKVSKKKDSEDVSKKSDKHEKNKFVCQICHKEVVETRICHHARKHLEDDVWTCPVCLQKFKSRKDFEPHSKKHIQISAEGHWKKKKVKKKVDPKEYFKEESSDELEPGQIPLDPSLAMYYQSTHDPVVLEHILEKAASVPEKQVDNDFITFDYIKTHYKLQNRDVYQCPASNCSKNFKLFKYLGVHIKNEHDGEDPNLKHYLEMKDRREKCTFCRKTFMTAFHHRQHRWMHYGDHPYMCVVTGCGARFDTTNELIAHKHSHGFRLSYGCELKGCSFSYCDLGQLYHHEAQHFRDAAYTCTSPDCKNFFYSRKEFLQHLETHDIAFTEKDFETQRKMKRKLLFPVVESSALKVEVENGAQKGSSSSQLSANSESKVSLTCVAVCFDGKKFTCGLNKCGRTYTTARELQKHLRIAHPDNFNEEDQLCKKKVQTKHSKTQANELHKSGQDNPLRRLSTEESNHEKAPSPAPVSIDCDPTLSSVELGATLTEIMLGLSQLSLNSPSTRYATRNSQSTCSPTLKARSPAKAANNKNEVRPHVSSSDSKKLPSKPESPQKRDNVKDSEKEQLQSEPSTKPYACEAKSCHYQSVTSRSLMLHYIKIHGYSEEKVKQMEVFQSQTFKPSKTPDSTENSISEDDQPHSEFLVQATTKPYTCEATCCRYQSVTSRALMQHYIKIHAYTEEEVKEMEVFQSQTFKPFKCHLCSKSYKNKKALRIHYIHMHHINKSVVQQMSCSFKKRLDDKALVVSSSKVRNRKKSMSLKVDDVKTQRREKHLWQQKCQKQDYRLWKSKLSRKNGQAKAEEKSKGPSQTDADVNHSNVDVRGSRRLVAKGNLSYIFTKYNKPFHCVHKNCNAAFNNQNALVGHLQLVHHYNRSQLCFPCEHKGCDKQFNNLSSLTKHYRREHNFNRKKIPSSKMPCKSKSIPKRQMASSEEPIPRFKCTYANCNESYHLNSSLLRHTSQFHQNQTPAATSANKEFKSSFKKHVFYRHCDPSDSLVVRLQSTPKKDESNSGCQTKLIISPSSQSSKDSQKLPLKQPLRCCLKDQEISCSEENFESIEETAEEELDEVPKTPKIKLKSRKGFDLIVFRTHEEALQMCQDRCFPVAFPCMVQNCDSVVMSMHSLNRHYIRVHKFKRKQLTDNKDKLCYTAEKLEEIIQKKSAVSAIPDLTRIPNGVLKMEYQSEPATPGGPSLPMSLHSIKTESKAPEVIEFSGEPLPDRKLLIAAEDLLYGSPKSSGHPEESASEESPRHKDRSESELTTPPLIRPPPLDLSPPSTLRIAVDESSFEASAKDSKSINIPSAVSISVPTPTRQPLRRKNELSEPAPPLPLSGK
ncbi:zinc finger protein Rlf [Garra rufa]|uniref:zinc finger protein Rlf n=1 Tax=Garra rufa TaxID=137080 RepID=UPI003CCE952D